jgi:hypothetical protein
MKLADMSATPQAPQAAAADRELQQWLEKLLSGDNGVRLIMPQDPGAVWTFIRRQAKAQDGVIESAALFSKMLRLDPGFITDYLARLCRGGFLQSLGRGRYRLLRNQPQPPQLRADGRPLIQALVREHIWRALKMSGWVTPRELAFEASTEEVRVSESAAQQYLAYLHRAGIVGARPSCCGDTAYGLKPGHGRGAAAPRVIRAIFVWDENARSVAGRTIVASEEVRL